MAIELSVVQGDAFAVDADILVAKYAQQTYGLDRAILANIRNKKSPPRLPPVGEHLTVTGINNLKAQAVLFLGVEPLHEFGYPQIRDFARRALTTLRDEHSDARILLLTLHGAGYGLDEIEAFDSEVAGLFDAINAGTYPDSLEKVLMVESDSRRAAKLAAHLRNLVPDGRLSAFRTPTNTGLSADSQLVLRSAGYASASKPHVFAAMPFAPEFDDLYHYGITGAVKASGYLCERADMSSFTGNVMSWVQLRIATAKLVIAELTGANPNVYLEVGFAWALRIPTVLLVNSAEDLRFDVRGQRVIEYKGSIRTLEEKLAKELAALPLRKSAAGA